MRQMSVTAAIVRRWKMKERTKIKLVGSCGSLFCVLMLVMSYQDQLPAMFIFYSVVLAFVLFYTVSLLRM